MTFASWCSSDKSSSPKSVESSVFSPRVAESESNLKIAAQEDISFNNNTPSVSSVKDDKHSSFGCNKNDLLIFMTNKMGVYSVQRESRPMWNNVDNIPPFISQAAHGRSGNVTFPAGSVNVPAPIPTGRQNRPAPVHADRPFPLGRRNSVSVFAGPVYYDQTRALWVREDGELLLSPQQVVLGETVDHICKGDPRTMVINSPCYHNKEVASPEQTATGKDIIKSVDGCDDFPKIIRVFQLTFNSRSKSWTAEVVPKSVAGSSFPAASSTYVVPTGRVVVPTGRYIVPAGKVIIIVSTGRLSLVPTGRILSPGRVK
ncbi:hypothetical protein Tco_0779981 [Tanacetum coccineum]